MQNIQLVEKPWALPPTHTHLGQPVRRVRKNSNGTSLVQLPDGRSMSPTPNDLGEPQTLPVQKLVNSKFLAPVGKAPKPRFVFIDPLELMKRSANYIP